MEEERGGNNIVVSALTSLASPMRNYSIIRGRACALVGKYVCF